MTSDFIRRGPRTKIGGLSYRPVVTTPKSIRDDDGIDHEVVSRSPLGDGRHAYALSCGKRLSPRRRRWKDLPANCLECIASEV
jgi:hypothetical protein